MSKVCETCDSTIKLPQYRCKTCEKEWELFKPPVGGVQCPFCMSEQVEWLNYELFMLKGGK